MTAIVGLMRFSVVTADYKYAWRATKHQPLDKALAEMLAPERLRSRLNLAVAMPLASLAGQTDGDFRLKTLVSSEMPAEIRQELDAALAAFPFADVAEVRPDDDLLGACRVFLRPGEPCVTFRLDDDDAVGRSFVADLRTLAVAGNLGEVLSFPHGLYVASSGGKLVFQDRVYPDNAFGLSYFSDDGRTILDLGSHTNIYRFPMVLHPRERAWMRSIHQASDSGNKLEGAGFRRADPGEVATLFPEFAIDAAALAAGLSPLRPMSNLQIIREGVRSARRLFAQRAAVRA